MFCNFLLPGKSSAAFSPFGNWQMEYIIRTKFLFFPYGMAYALISTSTPLGKSNLLNASTVRDDDV